MKISIIIPFYNSEKTIRKCILSILNSNFNEKFEIIVIDDGSTDKSLEIINDLNIKILSQKNKGAGAARNRGAKKTQSNLLLFVDSDVIFYKNTLKQIYKSMTDDIDYISVRYSKTPMNHKWINKYKALADYFYLYDFLFSKSQKKNPIKNVILSGGVECYNKNVFFELGGFDEQIKGASIEREKLFSKLTKNHKIVAYGNIKTKHYFPNFYNLTKNYFLRTRKVISLIGSYSQPYYKKNIIRLLLGALTVILFFASIFLNLIYKTNILIKLTYIVFIFYLILHYKMFIESIKKYNFFFMIYMILMNLFFCTVISFAGFLGFIDLLVKND